MDFKRILRYTIFSGIFLIPFIPLYITGSTFFPFVTGKNFAFRIIVEIIFGSWLILALKYPEYRPKRTWLFYAITAFVGVIALADVFSGHFLKSFWSNFERMEGLVTLLHLLAYFLVLTSFIKKELIWDRLLMTSIGASLINGLFGVLQLFGHFTSTQSGSRLDGRFGNASYMAVYMLFHIFISSYLLSKHQGSKGVKWLYRLIIAFQTFILIFTQTRGTMLGLFGGVVLTFLLIAIFEKERLKLRKVSAGILIGLIILGGAFFALRDSKLVQGIAPLQRLASISITETTTASRFLVWNMAYQGFKEKPILGWGQENFIFVFEKYFDPGMYAQEPWFDRAHNIFFDWLIAGGALGLLAYLSLFVFSLRSLWKSSNFTVSQKSLFTGLLAGYFFHNIFVFDNITSYIMFILVLAFINNKAEGFEKTQDYVEEQVPRRGFVYGSAVASVVVILTIFSIYFFNAKGIMTSRTLLDALRPQDEGPVVNLELFKEALAYDTFGNQEIREQLIGAASASLNIDIPVEVKEDFVTTARNEMQKQIDSNPISARHQIFMGSFLNRVRLYDEAIPYLERGLELSPTKQPTYFELVTNYLNTNQLEKTEEPARIAYELEENFDIARTIYAMSLIYNGKITEAENLIEERYGEKVIADERLIQAYFNTGNLSKALAGRVKFVENEPNNIQHRVSLAATYLQIGERNKAILELRAAIDIDPNFKEQGEFFIREIEAGRNP